MYIGQEAESDFLTCIDETAGASLGCSDRHRVLTCREQDVLRRIREASFQAREIKAKMKQSGLAEAEFAEAERELKRLRKLREDLEVERIQAGDERMRILGHLQ